MNLNIYNLVLIIMLFSFKVYALDFIALPDSSKTIRTIIIGSCSDQNLPMPHWNTINLYKPDILILAGDNVYGDFKNQSAVELRKAYIKLSKNSDFVKLAAEIPVIPIWDDHDYGQNDGGISWAYKDISKNIFLDFYKIGKTDVRRHRDGIFTSYNFGENTKRVQIIVLDTRTFRSDLLRTNSPMSPGKEKYIPDTDLNKTILGRDQWKWLKKEIVAPKDIRIIVSSIQVIANGHGWEKWGNFPLEREKLLSLLLGSNTKLTIILSGDRHIGAIYNYFSNGTNTNIYELTSSSLNKSITGVREFGPNRISDIIDVNNIGMLHIDWIKQKLRLSLHSSEKNNKSNLVEHIIDFND